jgi:hypothetical protein
MPFATAALDIDATALLPPDDESSGFDNIADVLKVSPSLMERISRHRGTSAEWLSAIRASRPARLLTAFALIFPRISISMACRWVRRGGILARHTFPLDGEYLIKVRLWRNTFDLLRGMETPHQIEIAMDGERVQLVTVGGQKILQPWRATLEPLARTWIDVSDVRIP